MNPPTSNNLGINYISQDQLQQPQQPAQPHDSGNWFTHLLPTIGSVGGTILGGIATGGLGGEFVGGAGGSALGQALENTLEGKQALQGNDLTAGIEGGVGSLLGGIAGKGLGKVGEFLGSRADTLADGAKQAANAADKLKFAELTKNNYGIVKTLQGGDHLALGSNQKFLSSMGIDATDPYQMAKAAEAGYSNNPEDLTFNSVYDSALQNAKPVDMSQFGNQVFDTMKATGTTDLSSSPLGKALQDFHTRTNGVYGSDNGIQLPSDMSAADVRKLQQSIGKEMGHQQTLINNSEVRGESNINAESAHATLSKLYDSLGGQIKTPEVDQAIASRVTNDKERQALIDKFGPKFGKWVADTIDNAQNADSLLTPMRSTTQMAQAGRMGIDNLENMSGTPEAIARAKANIPDATPQSTTPGQALTNAGATIANPHIGLVDKALGATKHLINNPEINSVMSRIAKLGDKLGTVGAQEGIANSGRAIPGYAPILGAAIGAGNSQLAPAVPGMQNANGIMGGSMQPTASNIPVAPQTDASGLNRNDLLTLALYSPSAFNALVTPSAAQQQNVVNANTAEQALSNLGSMNTPSMGLVSSLAGKLGIGSAGAYDRQAQQAAQEIAAAIPGSDQHAITAELTNYMAGGASIQDAIRSLMANLNAVKQGNTNAPYQMLMNFHPAGQPTL